MVEKVRPDSILPSVAMQKNGWNQCHDAFNEALSVERLEKILLDTHPDDFLRNMKAIQAIRREVGLDA